MRDLFTEFYNVDPDTKGRYRAEAKLLYEERLQRLIRRGIPEREAENRAAAEATRKFGELHPGLTSPSDYVIAVL